MAEFIIIVAANAILMAFIELAYAQKLKARISRLEKAAAERVEIIRRAEEVTAELVARLQGWMPAISAALDVAPHLDEIRAAAARLREFDKTY